MPSSLSHLRWSLIARVGAAGLVAGIAAGCSSDTVRFSESPFSNPFSKTAAVPAEPVQTASLAPAPDLAARPQPSAGAATDLPSAAMSAKPQVAPPANLAVYKTERGTWSAAGGSMVTVKPGDTVVTLADRYGVPAAAISNVNRLSSPTLSPGQIVAIPAFTAKGAASTAADTANPAKDGTHVVVAGETLSSIARANNTTRTELAAANGLDANAQVRIGQTLRLPGVADAAPAKAAAEAAKPAEPVKTAAEPAKPAAAATQTAAASEAAAPAANGPQFRWPVKGRVIQTFGSASDGISISVPEGTDIRAAEDGVVAFAGDELKNYGNLVLIRHEGGWVTAYGHAKAINVKRGETVKRGQVIATAGQTGDVTSPQVLFELRKGATPVDPRRYLSGT